MGKKIIIARRLPEYEALDLLIISAGTLSIYQNDIPLDEFLRHTPDIPTILMETDCVHGDGISMISDNTQGIADCVEHLITAHGLTRIGFISGPDNNLDAAERFNGYRNTLLRHGLPVREEYIVPGDYSEHVDKSVKLLLDRAEDLQAIVSANDEMAVAVYRVCRERGLKVGEDIAVTGYDREDAPKMYRNRLSFRPKGSYMTFLLFDEQYQYGVLNVEIEPERIDLYYMLSLDIGTSLRYMDIWNQQKRYRAKLHAMARTDELTGLYNRTGLVNAMEGITSEGAHRVGILMADLDHMKQINDRFGHREGDIALKRVADILRSVLGSEQIIGRIGGDEFQACFIQPTDEQLQELSQRIRSACDAYNAISNRPYYLEISVGCATGTVQRREEWESLAAKADEALYAAKKN